MTRASKTRDQREMVHIRMRDAWSVLLLVLATIMSAAAQVPAAAPSSSSTSVSRTPDLIVVQPVPQDTFNGSGVVDKPVPGVVSLSLLDALDRGLRHNLGLLLSQQQTERARAQYRRQLSALLPNVSGNTSESVNQINLAAFGIPLPQGLTSPVIGPFAIFDV